MINAFYSTDRGLQIAFNIDLESHYTSYSNSKLTNKPNFPEFGIEYHYNKKILKEMVTILARLINPYIRLI